MTKVNFVNLLSNGWHEGITTSNVISGFRTTGIYSFDREKYPKLRIDSGLLKKYDACLVKA